MQKRYIHNRSDDDVTVGFDGENTVFPANSVKTIEYAEEQISAMVDHFVNNGGENLSEVSAEEARELTSGKVGRPSEPKVAKAVSKSQAKREAAVKGKEAKEPAADEDEDEGDDTTPPAGSGKPPEGLGKE